MHSRELWVGALCAVGFALPARGADVLVVDPSGGGDAVAIQEAVDAAAEGDIVLVREGVYDEDVLIEGQSLTLIADGSVACRFLTLRDLGPDQVALVSGLEAQLPTGSWSWRTSAGPVRVQGCRWTDVGYPSPSVHVEAFEDLALVDCTFVGRDGVNDYVTGLGGNGRAGLHASASRLALYDCEATGGKGGYGTGGWCYDCATGGDGGPGLLVYMGSLFAMNLTARGGAGGNTDGCCGGDGGDGLLLVGSVSALLSSASTFGGPGGTGFNGTAPAGAPMVGGPVEFLGAVRRTLRLPSVVAEGESLPIAVVGRPGDQAWLLESDRPARVDQSFARGLLFVEPRSLLGARPIGTVAGDGSLEAVLRAPTLLPGEEGRACHYQVLVRDIEGELVLGSPRVLVVLDPALL